MVDGNGERPWRTALIDFAATNPSYDLSYEQRIVHGGVNVCRCILPPNSGRPVGSNQLTIVVHDGTPFEMQWRLPHQPSFQRRTIVAGMAHLNPADNPIEQEWEGRPRILAVALTSGFVDAVTDEAFNGGVLLRPHIGIHDRDLATIGDVWRRELREGGPGGRLFTESLGTIMLLHVLRNYGIGIIRPQTVKGGLRPARLNRVIDYIDDHLETNIGLRDLAAIAEVSQPYFGEAFKASTGLPPYRFIVERRISRAKELLFDRAMPIAEIALRVGFANQSHFTVNFRKVTGTTPARFRADTR